MPRFVSSVQKDAYAGGGLRVLYTIYQAERLPRALEVSIGNRMASASDLQRAFESVVLLEHPGNIQLWLLTEISAAHIRCKVCHSIMVERVSYIWDALTYRQHECVRCYKDIGCFEAPLALLKLFKKVPRVLFRTVSCKKTDRKLLTVELASWTKDYVVDEGLSAQIFQAWLAGVGCFSRNYFYGLHLHTLWQA